MQDRCTICAERTIGSEIILAQPKVVQCDVGQVETRFGTFRDSVKLDAQKSFWMHLIVLLCDVDQAEVDFDLFGDSCNLGARKFHGLCLMYHGHGNRFGHTQWYSYVMYAKWKLVSVRLEILLDSAQDRCTVCAELTIGLEIILDAPNGTPR
jgi:hypothetical protein